MAGCGQQSLHLGITPVEPTLAGLPAGPSHKTNVSLSFGGDAAAGIYKIGIAGTTNCDNRSGYSAAQVNGVPFQLDVSALPDGEIALCYIGISSNGRKGTPERKTWIKDTGSIEYVELSESEVRVTESDTTLNYTVTLSTTKSYDVKIMWERVDGDAIYGVHHLLAATGNVTIPAGQTSAQVHIPILDNTANDGEKYFGLRLLSTNSTRVHVGPDYQILIYEKDNDGGQASRLVKLFSNMQDTCALYLDGSVKCRGFNQSLIQGTALNQYHDLHVITGLSSGVTDLSSGGIHFCALMSDQTVRCWGEGSNGQLGGGGTADSSTLITPAISGVTQIALTERSSCALKTDGTIWCWGKNNYG